MRPRYSWSTASLQRRRVHQARSAEHSSSIIAMPASMSGPASRLTPEVRQAWIDAGRETAATISRALGYRAGRGGPTPLSDEVIDGLQPHIGSL